MAVTIQVRHGAAAGLPIGADGEPLWTTDTHTLYVAQGGVDYPIGGPGSFPSESANTVFAGPTSGGAAAPTFRALVAADMPAGGAPADVTAARMASWMGL
jgi:hypothetical protein